MNQQSIYSEDLTQLSKWDVIERPVFSFHGSEFVQLDNKKALHRTDTGDCLSVVSKDYRPMYNEEFIAVAEFLVSEYGMKIKDVAEHSGGRKLFLAFERPDTPTQIGGLKVSNYMTFWNSHDGTTGIGIGTNSMFHRCQNMFNSAHQFLSIRHHDVAEKLLKDINFNMDRYVNTIEQEYNSYEKMMSKKYGGRVEENLIKQLFSIDNFDDAGGRLMAEVGKLRNSIEIETGALGKTAFGLWNGVTHYCTHERTNGRNNLWYAKGKETEMTKKAKEYCLAL